MWRNEEVVWCTSCRELVPHKRQTHTKSMFSIVLGIANRLSFSDQIPYAGSRAGGRAGGRAGSELELVSRRALRPSSGTEALVGH